MKAKLLIKLRKKHIKRYKIVKYKDIYRLYRDDYELDASHYLDIIKEKTLYEIRRSIQTEVNNIRIKIGKTIKFYPYD